LWKFNQNSDKKIEPVLKLTQNDAILTLAFNPLTYELFSGGTSDFALFIPGKKEIPKEKFKEKIICSAWSSDGQTLAFGTINGTLSLRQRNLEEKVTDILFRMNCISMLPFGAWNGVPSPPNMNSHFCWSGAGIRLSIILMAKVREDKNSARDIFPATLFLSTSTIQGNTSP